MKKWILCFTYLCVAILGCIVLQKFCRKQTDGFAIHKISSTLPYNSAFETHSLSNEEMQQVKDVLDQPFHYLARGAQCYVFASEDGNFVLKFFRLHQLGPSPWLMNLPLPSFLEPYRQNKIKSKLAGLSKDFLSYKIAFEQLKEDTGLIYVHLNKTDILHKKVTLVDKINIKHTVDIDAMEFLIQKKADLFYPAMQRLIQDGEKDKAKESLKHLVHFLAMRSSLGIGDIDPDINTNFGICQGRPVQIDVGRFHPSSPPLEPHLYVDDILQITDNLKQWLQSQDKELADSLLEEIYNLTSTAEYAKSA